MMEAWVQTQGCPSGIFGGQSGTEAVRILLWGVQQAEALAHYPYFGIKIMSYFY
jgi:hypothetical protein